MKEFVVSCVQFSVVPNDVVHNLDKATHWLRVAAYAHEAELVVFPESVTTGFTPGMAAAQFWDLVDPIPGASTELIQAEAERLGVYVVFSTYERGEERPIIYNTVLLIGPNGDILGRYRKTHPFPTERLEAGGWTTPGNEVVVVDTPLAKIGLICCYDGDFPELSRCCALRGAEVIARPSAFMRSFDIWNITNCARAYDNHVYMLACNAVGPDAGGNYYFGHSMIVSPTAQVLAQARGTEEVISHRLNTEPIKYLTHGSRTPMMFDHLEDRNVAVYKDILREGRSPFEPSQRIPYRRPA